MSSSEWVDTNGDQWQFSNTTRSWLHLVNGRWVPDTVPAEGLRKVRSGTPVATVTAPPWPECDPAPDAPQWVDSHDTAWRQNPLTGTWQKLVGSSWVNASLPSGGLRKFDAATDRREVVVVETMGPRGQSGQDGQPGPPGLTYIAISEVLPAQYQNGVNDTFPLSDDADLSQAIQIFRNGLLELPGLSYLVTQNSVTFTTPPLDSDVLTVVYQKAQ